jgi:predicted dithiol-disulfide oxidoreductase (DUF899 family)
MSKHDVRFPGETKKYRRLRDQLLDAEANLRQQIESVAVQRRKLPLGGEVPQDYTFGAPRGKRVRMSELFAPGKDTLIIYSFMYGPQMEEPCPL